MTVRVGAQILTYGSTWDQALDTVKHLDDLGYDYIWGHDHLYSTGGDPYQGFFEGWTTLTAWAMATKRARLGLLVGANTFRNPGVVAKMAVTVDHASGGRSILGLGAGNVEFENRAHGIDPGITIGQRLDWFEEALAMVIDLLAGREVTHRSDKYQFDHVRHSPQPVQDRIPVVIGADGEKRGLRIAARHADIWQWFAPFDGVELFRHKDEVLRAHAETEGRDADDDRADGRLQADPAHRPGRGAARRRGARRDPQVGPVGVGRGVGHDPRAHHGPADRVRRGRCPLVQPADRLAVRPRDHRSAHRRGHARRQRAGRLMQFGFGAPPGDREMGRIDRTTFAADLERQIRFAEPIFDSIWVSDHLMEGDRFRVEPWTHLTWIAARTSRVMLGNNVLANSYRPPALMAKMAASLQVLSGGRFILGYGAGWLEDEYRAYGYPFPSTRERIAQMDEGLRLIRALWTPGPITFEGEWYTVTDAYCEPRPDPPPPIMIGGSGERYLLRAVAEHADWWLSYADHPDVLQRGIDALAGHCRDIGRDPAEIRKAMPWTVYLHRDRAAARRLGG